jgi:hypothetical protein
MFVELASPLKNGSPARSGTVPRLYRQDLKALMSL